MILDLRGTSIMMDKNEKVKPNYKICGVLDIETSTVEINAGARAFPYLFTCHDVRDVDLREYDPDTSGRIHFFRRVKDALVWIENVISDGLVEGYTPVICAYNLYFDIKPFMYLLNQRYKIEARAQSTTSVYTLDVIKPGTETKKLLRFWDVSFLEKNGLKTMGDICGLPKIGDFDYEKIRTPKTPLTTKELEYAERDVRIIPAYLRYLLESNDFLKPNYFGSKIITKTSLVRQMARYKIGNRVKFEKENGKNFGVYEAFKRTCEQEFPVSFQQYALRKSCFRGGFSFISCDWASQELKNVISLDVNSMHHLFINGAYFPVEFKAASCDKLEAFCWDVMNTKKEDILKYYYKPFLVALHVRVDYKNLRLKKNSTFERNQIGLISEDRFARYFTRQNITQEVGFHTQAAEENLRWQGWVDKAKNAIFTYGKLMSAEHVSMHVNEIELWNIAQVYDFDDFEVRLGEYTQKFKLPPDYVSLQSNILFSEKMAMKNVLKIYQEGKRNYDVSPSIPKNIRHKIMMGEISKDFLEGYYVSTVKSMFNSIFGTQSMDLMRPDWIVRDGDLFLDEKTFVDESNFDEKKPKNINVLYTYGMRISSRSRIHLILALLLLDERKDDLEPVSGDTDSLKLVIFTDITDKKILSFLEPLQKAATRAINFCQKRVRKNYSHLASDLKDVGLFEIEKTAAGGTRWDCHFEGWQKARLSMAKDENGKTKFKFVCAGLSRPEGKFNILDWVQVFYKNGKSFKDIANIILGYNTFFMSSISHSLQRNTICARDIFRGKVKDYTGVVMHVVAPECVALSPAGVILSDVMNRTNQTNLWWQEKENGRTFDLREKFISQRDGLAVFEWVDADTGEIFEESYKI